MKILLFGEYNRFHKFLKDGLNQLHHDAIVISREDAFKDVDIDICIEPKLFKKKLPHFARRFFIRLFSFDIADLFILHNFFKHKNQLKGHDVVQLINEFPLQIHPYLEKKCLNFLFKNNKTIYLSACSDDCIYVDYLLFSNKNGLFSKLPCIFKEVKTKRKIFRQSWKKDL